MFVRDFAHAVCAVCGVTNGVGALPIVVERCVGAYEGVGTQKQARGEVFVLVKHALGKTEAAHDATFKDVTPHTHSLKQLRLTAHTLRQHNLYPLPLKLYTPRYWAWALALKFLRV